MELISTHTDPDTDERYAVTRDEHGDEDLIKPGAIYWAASFGFAEVDRVHHDGVTFIIRGDGEYRFHRRWARVFNPR